jgi:hypothetical protein
MAFSACFSEVIMKQVAMEHYLSCNMCIHAKTCDILSLIVVTAC